MGPDSRATLGPHPKSFPSHCSPPPPKDQALLSPSASCCHVLTAMLSPCFLPGTPRTFSSSPPSSLPSATLPKAQSLGHLSLLGGLQLFQGALPIPLGRGTLIAPSEPPGPTTPW